MKVNTPMSDGTGLDRQFTVSVARRSNYVTAGGGLAILVVLALLPLFGGTEWTRRMTDLFCFMALAQLWNLMLGYGGIISVGQQGFIGIGAYTLWFFSDIIHMSPFAAGVFAAIAGGFVAEVFGWGYDDGFDWRIFVTQLAVAVVVVGVFHIPTSKAD